MLLSSILTKYIENKNSLDIDLVIMLPHKVEPNTLLKIQICRKNNTQLEHVWRGAKDTDGAVGLKI